MEEKQKDTRDKNRKKQKTALTKEEQKICDEFKRHRLNCRMNQKQWAEKIGISYGLVKRIETHTIVCSAKTMSKVQQFLTSYKLCPAPPDLHDLEELILFDVFLTKMQQIPRPEAAVCAEKCTQSLRNILSQAAGYSSDDGQKRYFEFVDEFLKLLGTISIDFMELADQTVDISGIMNDIALLIKKKIPKPAPPPSITEPVQAEEFIQMTFSDFNKQADNFPSNCNSQI